MIAIYARQSVDKKDSISIETQLDLCKKELSPDEHHTIYHDKGYSGKNTSRPAFQKLLNAVSCGEVTKIVVYRLDRISRSITDFADIMDLCQKNDVSFISVNEKFDTSTPVGRAMLYIIMIFAQLERETIAERIRDNYYARGQKGVWLGGPAPLGFKTARKHINGKNVAILEPNENIAVIQEIFSEYANTDASLGSLAKSLHARHGGMWNNIKLARIIHNPAYVKANADIYHFYQRKNVIIINDIAEFTGEYGCSLYGKRDRGANKYNSLDNQILALALHHGVIDSKTWLLCQSKSENNKQIKNTGKGKHTWLTGLIKCGYCEHSMIVRVYGKFKYLVCSGRYNNADCLETLSTHHLEDIEEHVTSEIRAYVANFDIVAMPTAKANIIDENSLKIELHKLEDEIQNLVSSISASNDTLMKYINERIIELDNKKSVILDQLNAQAITPEYFDLPDISHWDTADIRTKHSIANRLIDKILVYNDSIKIGWKL